MTGWGDFNSVHSKVIASIPEGSTIVELGVAFGQGLACMVNTAKKLNKKLRIVGIDSFKGTPGEDFDKYYGKDFCLKNTVQQLSEVGVNPGDYELIQGDTADSSSMFDEVHYVFLDADHSYDGVLRDIKSWWPKVAIFGYIGGHDFEFPTVSKAVKSVFPRAAQIDKQCWLFRKEQ